MNVFLKNHTYLQWHMHSLTWPPTEFLMSCSLLLCSVTIILAYSFGSTWGWFQAMWCAVSADHKCLGVSTPLSQRVTDNDVGRPYLLPHAVLQSQLYTVLDFSRVTWTLWRFCSSRTTSFAHDVSVTITQWAKICRGVMLPSATGKISYINYYISINPLTRVHVTLG